MVTIDTHTVPQTALLPMFSSKAGAQKVSLNGIWVSRGYGWILKIEADGYSLFDHTSQCCVEIERGTRQQFREAFDRVCLDGQDALSLHVRGEISRYDFDRIDSFPSDSLLIGENRNQNVQLNFQSFCEYFRQDYAFFELRGVEWEALCDKMQPSIKSDMSANDLFDIMGFMIGELKDNHAIIQSQDRLVISDRIAELKSLMAGEFGLTTANIGDPDTIARLQPFVCKEFLNNASKTAGNGAINWGFVEPDIGYLNVLKLFGLADTHVSRTATTLPHYRYDHARMLEQDLQALESILDQVMTDFARARAIILDIRINGGGFDRLGMAIANRFCAADTLGFTKEGRCGDGFMAAQHFHINPTSRPSFQGPVYVLTSARTASAGEILTLCMRALPDVTLVGEPTTGILSDNLAKTLPNGWVTSISNEIYRAHDGEIFEKSGVPVDVPVRVFQSGNFVAGLHHAIEASRDLATAIHV